MAIIIPSQLLKELGVASPSADDLALAGRVITDAATAVEGYLGYSIESALRTEFYPIARPRLGGRPVISVVGNRVAYGREGNSALILSQRPVRNDADLEVREQYGAMAGQLSGSFGSGTILTKGSDYYVDLTASDYSLSGILYRYSGVWPMEPGSIKVTYRSGFTANELAGASGHLNASAITAAVLEEACRLMRQRKVNQVSPIAGYLPGQITSESLSGYSNGISGNVMETSNLLELSILSKRRLQKWRKIGGFIG